MILLGLWVVGNIKSGVTQSATSSAALRIEQFIERVHPIIQELKSSQTLSQSARDRLATLDPDKSTENVLGFKVWRPDGTIVYSSWQELIGQKFAPSVTFLRALGGEFAVEFATDEADGDGPNLNTGHPVMEIYAPLHSDSSGEIIAVVEHYSIDRNLSAQLASAAWKSWLVVSGISLLMLTALYRIVHVGSRTIDQQREQLTSQIARLETLLEDNKGLQTDIKRAHARTAEINERQLRRIGADLHDGPAQLLSLAALLTHALDPEHPVPKRREKIETVNAALADSLKEIRSLSAGLLLPDIEQASLEQVLRWAIEAHVSRTKMPVTTAIDLPSGDASKPFKVCAYRFVQEALNNAFKHAGGIGQAVSASQSDGTIELVVSDQGPGLRENGQSSKVATMGLAGMRDRIEMLGGNLDIQSRPIGCRLTARFDLQALKQQISLHE